VLEKLALRTGVVIPVGIESKGLAWQQAVGLVLSIQYRNMRDNLAFRQPAQERACALSFVSRQLFRPEMVRLFYPLQHGFGGDDLLRQSSGSGFNVNHDGMIGVNQIVIEVSELAPSFLHIPRGGGIGG